MITSMRVLMREASEPRLWAMVLEWLNDQPRGRWHTLTDAASALPVDTRQLYLLWSRWVDDGWMEHKRDGDGALWRPTDRLPIVSKRERDERLSQSDYFSSLLELPVR